MRFSVLGRRVRAPNEHANKPHSVHELIARIRAVVRRDDDSEISEGFPLKEST